MSLPLIPVASDFLALCFRALSTPTSIIISGEFDDLSPSGPGFSHLHVLSPFHSQTWHLLLYTVVIVGCMLNATLWR